MTRRWLCSKLLSRLKLSELNKFIEINKRELIKPALFVKFL